MRQCEDGHRLVGPSLFDRYARSMVYISSPHGHKDMSRDALRRGRFSAPGQIYHITTCTKDRRPHFDDPACARMVIREMRGLHDNGWLSSFAWVLMPDHLHWLFELGPSYPLDRTLKRLKGRSGQALGHSLQRSGPIWQPGYTTMPCAAKKTFR